MLAGLIGVALLVALCFTRLSFLAVPIYNFVFSPFGFVLTLLSILAFGGISGRIIEKRGRRVVNCLMLVALLFAYFSILAYVDHWKRTRPKVYSREDYERAFNSSRTR
jgi:hypothetical protein